MLPGPLERKPAAGGVRSAITGGEEERGERSRDTPCLVAYEGRCEDVQGSAVSQHGSCGACREPRERISSDGDREVRL